MPQEAHAAQAEIVDDHTGRSSDAGGNAWRVRWLDWLTTFVRGRPGSATDRSLTIAFVALGAGVIVARSFLDSMRQIRRRFA